MDQMRRKKKQKTCAIPKLSASLGGGAPFLRIMEGAQKHKRIKKILVQIQINMQLPGKAHPDRLMHRHELQMPSNINSFWLWK